MRCVCRDKLTLALIALALINPAYANDFGRLFTSPDERQELEKLRHQPDPSAEVYEPKLVELKNIPDDAIALEVIKLDGIVYRGGGKSTAWINKINTYDGNIQPYSVQVSKEDIDPDGVTITLPNKETRLKMKVGDYFDPNAAE